MKFLFALIAVTIIFNNCKNKQSEIVSKEYLKSSDSTVKGNKIEQYLFTENDNIYVAKTDYYKKGDLLSIRGYLLDGNYGGNFFFFSKGGIESYEYVVGNDYSSYYIKYKNKLYIEGGSPLVDFWKKECKESNDSRTCLIVYFSYFPRKTIRVQYSLDGLKYQPLDLQKSKLLPFVLQAKLEAVSIKGKPIFFIIDADDPIISLPGIDFKKLFHDTLTVR